MRGILKGAATASPLRSPSPLSPTFLYYALGPMPALYANVYTGAACAHGPPGLVFIGILCSSLATCARSPFGPYYNEHSVFSYAAGSGAARGPVLAQVKKREVGRSSPTTRNSPRIRESASLAGIPARIRDRIIHSSFHASIIISLAGASISSCEVSPGRAQICAGFMCSSLQDSYFLI